MYFSQFERHFEWKQKEQMLWILILVLMGACLIAQEIHQTILDTGTYAAQEQTEPSLNL